MNIVSRNLVIYLAISAVIVVGVGLLQGGIQLSQGLNKIPDVVSPALAAEASN